VVTSATSKELPEYYNPPVNEVVCGILYDRIDKLLNPYLGILWEKFKPEYSECREVAPLVPVIENFGRSSQQNPQYADFPPLPRTWFVHSSGNGIIQIQRDRFLHNWRKIRPEDEYPRYRRVIDTFQTLLSRYTEFLDENSLGVITPLQYELTYINHIMKGEGWETNSDIGKIFPNFAWHTAETKFLPDPDSINWHTSFPLPNRSGRLHTRIQTAIRRDDELPLLRFELTARGIGEYKALNTMWSWFELAHEGVVRGFAGLTDPQVQRNIWRQKP
jgi:uncharacterized protein (TIGR04255 family)